MSRLAYPATLIADPDGGFTVTFDDVPEAITEGDDRHHALAMAREALGMALGLYADDGGDFPQPTAADGRPMVAVSALVAAKLALRQAQVLAGITNVELAKRLGVTEGAVRKLRRTDHASKIDSLEAALSVLGKRLEVRVRDAA